MNQIAKPGHVFIVKGSGGQGSKSGLVGIYGNISPEFRKRCDENWWIVTEVPIQST